MFPRLLCAVMLALPLGAATTVLYDDGVASLPAAQGWLFFGDNSFGAGASQTLVPGGTQLVTNGGTSAGYANRIPFFATLVNAGFPVLDRNVGFSLLFELKVTSESHSSNDRAGFSVILLSEDKFGIELGFWADEIWAQSGAGFTHAEGVSFDTTAAQRQYELLILGSTYWLSADGTEILTGSLRDYSGFGSQPYTLSRFLFLGDDTSSAGADVLLGRVELADVPEPATAGLVVAAVLLAAVWRRGN
ncbi:MAG: hypothetical protein JST93_25255 [Acidobacteria bacterium]|nr:hypothetical protein [Acidobacteriota bacterium]